MRRLAIHIVLSLLFPCLTYAFPLPKGPRTEARIPYTFTQDFNFEGIVSLSSCSGSLVRYEFSKDSDHAMVLTNGHCFEMGMPLPGEFYAHRPSHRGFMILDPQGRSLDKVTARELIYATMTRTDIALYELRETYAEIQARFHTRPFTLSSKHPQLGTAIDIISGYWRRGYRCQMEAFVHELDEEGYQMYDSIRYSKPGCEVIGGTSGSPVVERGTRSVVAVNNTGNENGERCTENNPCEIDENGKVSFQQGWNYAQQTYILYTCLAENGELDLNRSGCLLPH